MPTVSDQTPTINEYLFYQLLKEEEGTVHVDLERMGKYFVPFVYFTAPGAVRSEPKGILLRQECVLAAKTRGELLHVLHDMTDDIGPWTMSTV